MRGLSRRASSVLLRLFAVFLLGTMAFLALVRSYFHVDASAYILPTELGTWAEIRADARPGLLDGHAPEEHVQQPEEKVPRIIHQTWKTEELPPRWKEVREACRAMMSDYQYMLWTDASSREFIAREYPWFLETFDSYPYNIQRADAIRYFVLHKYGGVYMDLDIGCRRRLDSLLRFEVVVPKTIPVGVSNDLMFSVPQHPYMESLIHSLKSFHHNYLTHYATVMFSTGPMFVSAMYRQFVNGHVAAAPSTPSAAERGFSGVRVLPKSLYGKNLAEDEAPDSFFLHMYGSSWHANDAGFLIFLRKYGYALIALGLLLVLVGTRRTCMSALTTAAQAFTSLVARVWMREARSSNEEEWIHLTDPDGKPTASPQKRGPVPTVSLSSPSSAEAGVALHDAESAAKQSSAPRGRRSSSPLPDYCLPEPDTLPDLPTQADGLSDTGSRTSLQRLRQFSGRTLTMGSMLSLVPPSLRRSSPELLEPPPSQSLTSVGVEGGQSRPTLPNIASDEYSAEWQNLLNRWDGQGATSPFMSPTSPQPPTPTLIEASDAPMIGPPAGGLMRRSQLLDVHRAMTPALTAPLEDAEPRHNTHLAPV
ncbi:hypothetical protein MCAP1_001489 [Malassezia caprae]|uniref:Mannosyl phosphorylinositol ceramide synthase SUR1 n=1 Tax=Malassezia caprae TaxID=1381934 RepID=A0AAF0IV29_9BASI|nr:hypothetical protein MCAP1_001489 [Malassezia caprae]